MSQLFWTGKFLHSLVHVSLIQINVWFQSSHDSYFLTQRIRHYSVPFLYVSREHLRSGCDSPWPASSSLQCQMCELQHQNVTELATAIICEFLRKICLVRIVQTLNYKCITDYDLDTKINERKNFPVFKGNLKGGTTLLLIIFKWSHKINKCLK